MQSDSQQNRRPDAMAAVIWPKEKQPEPAAYKPDCARPQNHEEADFCEQRRVAKASEELVALTDWQTRVRYYEIGLLIGAVGAAIWAAWAATSAVRLARETARRELRAYVFGRPKNVNLSGNTLESITLTNRNHGSTPASKVGMKGAVNIYPYPLPPDFDIPFPEVEETTQNLPPHTEFPATINVGRHVSDVDEQRLRAGTHRVYALAAISYRDAFKEPRDTQVCASMHGPTFMQAVDLSRVGERGSPSLDDAWQYCARYNDWT